MTDASTLYVDHQDGDPAVHGGYGNPVAVHRVGTLCDLGASPAFSPDARRLAFVQERDTRCTINGEDIHVVDVDASGRYAATPWSELVRAWPTDEG